MKGECNMICEDCKVKNECMMYEDVWKKQLGVIKELKSEYGEYGLAEHMIDLIDKYTCDCKE
jgi:hypothetical protein